MNKTKLWTSNLIVIVITNFLTFFAFLIFPSALPPYLKSLGASDSILGWMQWILTVASLLVRPLTGIAIDKYGRRGLFLTGLICLMLTSGAYYFFPVVGIVLMLRFIHGIAWGMTNTACSTIAADNVEKKRFAEGMGYVSLASGVAMAVAPAVALSITMQNSIFLAFGVSVFCLILSFSIKYKKLPDAQDSAKRRIAPYAKESVLPSAAVFFVTATYGALITFLALYGAEKSIENIALFFAANAVSILITRPFVGKLVDKKGYGFGIWPGIVLMSFGLILLSASNGIILFLACAILHGIGMAAAQTSLQAMAIMRAPKDRIGAANATFFSFFDGGVGLGSVIAGFLASGFGYGNMFAFMAISPVLTGVFFFVIIMKQRKARYHQVGGE